MSRIWIGVVPPEDDAPGYAAVVGEILDLDPRPGERPVRLMDEAVALDPRDFSSRERAFFRIPDNNLQRPTKKRLAQAVVALKDIYCPQRIVLPPGRNSGQADRRQDPFADFLRKTDGLVAYDRNLGDYFFRRWYPFFRRRDRLVHGIVEAPFEDRAYNLGLLDSLYESGVLKINEQDCPIFHHGPWLAPRRCTGLLLAEMEYQDMTTQVRHWTFGDSYGEMDDDPDEETIKEALADAQEGRHRSADIWRHWAAGARGETP